MIPSRKIDEPVTTERLERALTLAAYVVSTYGPTYIPIFERVERELEDRRRRADASTRAALILECHTIDGRVKAIR